MSARSGLRAEVLDTLRLAGPVLGSQLLLMSMGTVDTVFAGRLSGETLAAVAVGANVFFLGFVLFVGLFMALAAQLAQRRGAGETPERLGQRVCGALGVAFVAGLIWWAFMGLTSAPLLARLGLSEAVAAEATAYLRIVSLATLPFCGCFVLRNAAEGLGLTRVPVAAGLVGLAVNALADYVLMFGHWGAPALGARGAAWASVASAVAMLAAYALAFARHPGLKPLAIGAQLWPHRFTEARALLRLGLPVAAILTAEAWLFQIGALLVARFGDVAVAAHQIAINFAALAFMVPLSVGIATTVRVGHAVGRGEPRAARRAGHVGIGLGALFAGISASLMWSLPEAIVGLYTRVEDVATLAAQLLFYGALFQLFDCLQATSNGALRGYHDTRLPMVITVTAYWAVGLPLAAGLAFGAGLGPVGVWWGFIGGLALAAAGLLWRFQRRASWEIARNQPAASTR